mmetsp:Transcript_10758/g.23714  ORF Transcript_10758/g.23714 Transcript_10758/m.23714 type:complete len:468 (+) Transcript_10758:57-1460(+)
MASVDVKKLALVAGGSAALVALLYALQKRSLRSQYSGTVSQKMEEIEADFCMTTSELKALMMDFTAEMDRGMDLGQGRGHEDALIKMLNARVSKLPSGKESGVVYAMDLGGTNLRVLRVKLLGGAREPEVTEFSRRIPDSLMASSATGDQLFDNVAEAALELVQRHNDNNGSEPIKCGFTFSFPMEQPKLASGILIEWTKGFATSNCVGKDAAELMNAAFKRKKVNMEVAAMCNDTVGTLMGCAYMHPTCRIGLILGTGSNACYFDPSIGSVINCEWGGFDSPHMRKTAVDMAIDKVSPNPSRQMFEKQISGLYLGEIVRRLFVSIFGERGMPEDLTRRAGWDTADVSHVLGAFTEEEVLSFLNTRLKWRSPPTAEMARVMKRLAELVVDRSAALCAAGIAAVARKTKEFRVLTVGIDGSVYKKSPGYQDRLHRYLKKLTPFAEGIRLVESVDGSGKGAALVVASLK